MAIYASNDSLTYVIRRLTPVQLIHKLRYTEAIIYRYAVISIHSCYLLSYASSQIDVIVVMSFQHQSTFFSLMNRYYGMHPTCTIVLCSTLTVCANLNGVVSINNRQLYY